MTVELCIIGGKALDLLFLLGHANVDLCRLVRERGTGDSRLKLGLLGLGLGVCAEYVVLGIELSRFPPIQSGHPGVS